MIRSMFIATAVVAGLGTVASAGGRNGAAIVGQVGNLKATIVGQVGPINGRPAPLGGSAGAFAVSSRNARSFGAAAGGTGVYGFVGITPLGPGILP